MNLRHYKEKIKAIDHEMEDIKQQTTPEIEQALQRLRELRENWGKIHSLSKSEPPASGPATATETDRNGKEEIEFKEACCS